MTVDDDDDGDDDEDEDDRVARVDMDVLAVDDDGEVEQVVVVAAVVLQQTLLNGVEVEEVFVDLFFLFPKPQ